MINFGEVPASSVLPIYFDSFAAATGAPITITGLAVTDIEVVKGTSVTVRASDAGYALLDTDGIDIGSRTGIHGFTIDLGDNTDAGFYAVGSFFTVLVDAVTIDSQTVRFIAATFRIKEAETTAGRHEARVASIANAAITAAAIATDAIDDDALAADAVTAIQSGLATPTNITAGTITTVTNVTTVNGLAAGVITAAAIATNAIDDDALAADAVTAIQSGLATSSALTTLIGTPVVNIATDIGSVPTNVLASNFEQDGEAGVTVAEGLRMTTAALTGKLSGAGTGTETVRNLFDTKNRIVYTVDTDGNRSAVTRDLT